MPPKEITVFKPKFPSKERPEGFKERYPKTFIAKSAFTSGADVTVYTVPAKKIFVLLAAWVGYVADNTSGGGSVEIQTTDPNMSVILGGVCKGTPAAAEVFNDNVTLSYPQGIRFAAGNVFKLWNSSSMSCVAGLSGYLVDEKALNLFYLD